MAETYEQVANKPQVDHIYNTNEREPWESFALRHIDPIMLNTINTFSHIPLLEDLNGEIWLKVPDGYRIVMDGVDVTNVPDMGTLYTLDSATKDITALRTISDGYPILRIHISDKDRTKDTDLVFEKDDPKMVDDFIANFDSNNKEQVKSLMEEQVLKSQFNRIVRNWEYITNESVRKVKGIVQTYMSMQWKSLPDNFTMSAEIGKKIGGPRFHITWTEYYIPQVLWVKE